MMSSTRRGLLALPGWIAVGLCMPLSNACADDGQPSSQAQSRRDAAAFTAAQLEHFEKAIRPLLSRRCYECHSQKARRLEASLYLDSRAGMLKGGDTGPAIRPGAPDDSLLIQAVHYDGDYLMPPRGKLPASEIKLLEEWVRDGAPWPAEEVRGPAGDTFDLAGRRAEHWCWQPIREAVLPEVADPRWSADPIDRFVYAAMGRQGLEPAPRAARETWLRRVYFTLIGLPPTSAQLQEFLSDQDPQAESRVVDRLLDSPHFGERWARHWLDLVRYAESRGHEFDYDTPNAYQYRDYVIRALNRDLPYDQFVVEHIAGDLLDEPRLSEDGQFNESLLATGFWHLGEWVHSPVDIRKDEADRHDNMVDVFGKTFLGLTIACARCHDHKFDAISQRDYYSLSGFLQSSEYRLARFDTLHHNRELARKLDEARAHAAQELSARFARLLQNAAGGENSMQSALLAAVKVLRDPSHVEDLTSVVDKLAVQYRVEPQRLRKLVEHLQAVADSRDDPLAPLAAFVKAEPASAADATWARRFVQQRALQPLDPNAEVQFETIVDYTLAETVQWLTDGPTFGAGPVHRGQLMLGLSADEPVSGVAVAGAARRDPAFRGLKVAPGSQNDAGKLAGLQRAGRILRTPTFELTDGRLQYLVVGTGSAFVVIDSHRMLNGPLHGASLKRWKHEDSQAHWETQDLRRYQGHRVHVEFSPDGDGDFAVLVVGQGAERPVDPLELARREALRMTLMAESEQFPTDPAAIKRLTDLFSTVATRLASDSDALSPGEARLADWMVRHAELLLPSSAFEQWVSACRKQLEPIGQLHSQVRLESRLAMSMWDGPGENERVMIRGNHLKPGEVAPRQLPQALSGGVGPDGDGSGRLLIARQLISPDNPLTSRVIVNRLWHHVFGRGLVPTVDNFGVLGERPSHPELLDFLARRFMEEGWSIKTALRQLVLTETFRQSSEPLAEMERLDPGNVWLHRMRVRRLEGEAIRDAMLVVSGRLDRDLFGPSVPVYLTDFMQGRGRPRQSGPVDGNGRRSIYISIRRNFLPPMMLAFDMPQPFSSMGRRTVSNVPAQALILMNDPFVRQQSDLWSERLLSLKVNDDRERIQQAYRMAYSREATTAEVDAALAFLEQSSESGDQVNARGWADLCHVLFNVKEFFFVP